MNTLLLGDISPTVMTAELYREKNIPELFTDAVCVFEGRDFVFANLECALTDHDQKIKKFGPALKAPRETAEVLKTLGVDLCGLSNNHVFDFGIKGIADTMKALRQNGIDFTGFGKSYEDARKNYTVEKDGERICIIAVCEHEFSYALEDRMGSRPYDEYDTMLDIREAKKTHDRVIVIYHGGKEYCRYPSPRLYKLCRTMAKHGADVVLCQHSHCIGAYEQYEGCHILYGQGNFHFVKPSDYDCWHTAFAVEYDTKAHKIGFIPVKATEHGIRLMKGEEREELMSAFEKRGQELLNGNWKQGWHEFCESMREVYTRSVGEAHKDGSTELQNALFSHYLDCEAHTDVYRELFPTYNLTNEK